MENSQTENSAAGGASELTDVLERRLAMAENKAELLAEDIECLHMCLDGLGVPRSAGENVYSMWGRVQIALRSNDLLGDRYFGDSHSTATLTKAQDDFIATASPATVKTMCDEIERLREVLQHMLSSDGISSGERGLINQVLNGAKQ